MGGRAFSDLHCPRINPDVYNKVKTQATAALQTVFANVVVPTEMPEKCDYGDIDFLVCSPLHSPGAHTIHDFPWDETVKLTKDALGTVHGRRGHLTNDCMYFAIEAPCDEDYFVQVDVKVCFKPELFEWLTFGLNYASNSRILGSMVKPLGLTIDPEGVHIRVEDIEETDHHGSMVWVSRDPKDVLRIAGLDHRIIHSGFSTREAIYRYFSSSWLFHPAHFAARLAEEKYHDRFEDRAPYWTHFIKEWVPEHCRLSSEKPEHGANEFDLQTWYKHTRTAVRNKVFTMFPDVAKQYYTKRAAHIKKQQEERLAERIMNAIPTGTDGWEKDTALPVIVFAHPALADEPSFPHKAPPHHLDIPQHTSAHVICDQPSHTPLHLPPLPHQPPIPCTPRPPPQDMSAQSKLACLARWTRFDASTGTPRVLSAPRRRDAGLRWTDAVDAGATPEALVGWAREAWWAVWARQVVVNYVGVWRRRLVGRGG